MAKPWKVENSGWRDGFLFVGNPLILDFLNTAPVQNGQSRELLSDFAALLRWYAAAGLLSSRQIIHLRRWDRSVQARRFTEAVREFREALREDTLVREQGGRVRGRTVSELNRLMTEHPMLNRLKAHGEAAETEAWFKTRRPEDLFAPLAHSAAMLFSRVPHDRVRKCGRCAAFLRHQQEGDAMLVQHATVWKPA